MLLRSHAGEIVRLATLPAAWPDGSVTGTRAHGGHELDFTGKDRKITAVQIRSQVPGELKIRINDESRRVRTTGQNDGVEQVELSR